MSSTSTPSVILGCFPISNDDGNTQAKFTTPEAGQEFLNVFRQAGYKHLDTARVYGSGTSETLLGQTDIASWAIVDTKVVSFSPGSHSAEGIKASLDASAKALKDVKINIMYLHAPDRQTPFRETVEAMNKGHQEGKFDKFGLSNYRPEEVEEIVKLCEENGWVKPTVYQGQYNAIARLSEDTLLPVLRRYNISYYAYSPSAAGIFNGTHSASSTSQTGTRFDTNSNVGKLYSGQYLKPALLDATAKVHDTAQKSGVSGHEVALRWVLHHSALKAEHGDAIIIGASSIKQLEQNIKACKAGKLDDELVKLVEGTWDVAKDIAPHAWM